MREKWLDNRKNVFEDLFLKLHIRELGDNIRLQEFSVPEAI